MMALVDHVPHLKTCYDIKPIDSVDIDYIKFHLTIILYTGKLDDMENPFAPLEEASSMASFKPFTENKYISTWHTNLTKHSNGSQNIGQTVPGDVVVDKSQHQADDNSQVTANSNPENPTPDKSKESGILFLDTTNSNLKKNVTFTKKQHIIKDEIVEQCNN